MGKGGGGSLRDSESTSWSLAINTHFRWCCAVTVGWASEDGWGPSARIPLHVSRVFISRDHTLISIMMLWIHQSGGPGGDSAISSQPFRKWASVVSFFQVFFMKAMMNGSAISCNFSWVSLTHPLTQPISATTDSCESLQRVMGCKWVNPTLLCLCLITGAGFLLTSFSEGAPQSWSRAFFWEYSRPRASQGKKKELSTVPFSTSQLQPCLNIVQTMQLRPEAESSADIVPTADYSVRCVDTGPLLHCCFTDSSCLALPHCATGCSYSCVSSHELLWWMGPADGIHNNILLEDVLILTGSESSWSLQERAWYRSPNTEHETGAGD